MDLTQLFEHPSDVLQVSAGEMVFAAGDPCNGRMYVVLEGRIEIRLGDRTLETIEAGGVFGEMALIEARPRSASAISQARSRLAVVDEEQFLSLVEKTPLFSLHLMRILAARLRSVNRRLT